MPVQLSTSDHAADLKGRPDGAARVPKPRGRPPLSAESNFAKMVELNDWIANSARHFAIWQTERKVECVVCSVFLSGKQNSANILTHAGSKTHIEAHAKIEAAKRAGKPSVLQSLQQAAALKGSNPLAEGDLTTLRSSLYYLGAFVGLRHGLEEVFTKDAAMIIMRLDKGNQDIIPAGGATTRVATAAVEDLEREIAAALKDKFFSVVIDEATLKLGRARRVLAIVVYCAEEEKAFLLDVVDLCDITSEDLELDDAEERAEAAGAMANAMAEPGASASSSAAPQRILRPSDRAAVAIARAFERYGLDYAKNCVSMMADGATFNQAVADNLGLPRHYCLPHVLALVFKAFTRPFSLFINATAGLSALLNAGGGVHRREAVEQYGMVVSDLQCVTTRWNQLQDMGKKLLGTLPPLSATPFCPSRPEETRLERIRAMLENHSAFNMQRGPAADDTDGEESDDEQSAAQAAASTKRQVKRARRAPRTSGAASSADDADAVPHESTVMIAGLGRYTKTKLMDTVKATFEVGVPDLLRKFYLRIELHMIENVMGQLPAVLTGLGAQPHKLDLNVLRQLKTIGSPLRVGDTLNGWKFVFEAMYGSHDKEFSGAERAAILTAYQTPVTKAFAAANAAFVKYIPQAIAHLQYRLRYDTRIAPEPYDTASSLKEFFGLDESSDGVAQVFAAWDDYLTDYPAFPYADKARPVAFWRKPDNRARYGESLCRLGRWYMNVMTSSVDCERVFARMRAMETPLRHSSKLDSIRGELLVRSNKDLVLQMINRTAQACGSKSGRS